MLGIFLSESFGEKRFKQLVGNRDETKVWLSYQEALKTKELNKLAVPKKVMAALVNESLRLRFKTQLFGPLILIISSLVNFSLYVLSEENFWLIPATVLILFGVSYLIWNTTKINNLKLFKKELTE